MAAFKACVDFTMRPENEGAYVDNPVDPGGATNFGITLDGLSGWRGYDCTPEDVRELTAAEAQAIYEANYWHPVGGDLLPAGIDLMVFDFGVNHGPGSAVKMLQRIVGAAQDGCIGPLTLARAQCYGTVLRTRIAALAASQEAFYASLHNQTFGKGWLARTKRRQSAAMIMTLQPSLCPPGAAAETAVASGHTLQAPLIKQGS